MQVPKDIAVQLSQRACEIARQKAPHKTGEGAAALKPMEDGRIGIIIPEAYIYMYFQEVGTAPHIQWELIKNADPNTIPIKLPTGATIFRKASSSNIGKRRIVSRDAKGRIIKPGIRWRNPGISGKHYIEQALHQAVNEWVRSLTFSSTKALFEKSEAGLAVRMIFGEDRRIN